ncbi:hypothetical protein ACHAQA_008382 [Verticillium albo-atrum]
MPPQPSSNSHFPQGCIAARDILDEKPKPGDLVNVVALVKDYYKCTLRLYDLSTQDGGDDLVLSIFRPEQHMPQVGPGDVLVIQSARVQRYRYEPLSLITHLSTSIHVYQAASIPRYPESPRPAMKEDPKNPASRPLAQAEAYVPWLYHSINKDCVPNLAEFSNRAEQSLNLKDKFSRLENVKPERFYDLIVQVVREPYDLLDKVTIWVTDYTENEAFFHMASDGSTSLSVGKDGDPYGYTTGGTGSASQSSNAGFAGPFGKRCMQLTCFEAHGNVVRRHVEKGAYIRLRNIQVKFGHNANNLEGFLRQDRDAAPSKVQVEVLDPTDPENIDPNLKQLIRRKREKRALKRAEVDRKIQQEEETTDEATLGLNKYVKCENMDQLPSTLQMVLERVHYQTTAHGSALDIQLPFTCAKYRVNARVIDFYPPRLQDFACSRMASEYDVLSDCGSSDSNSDDDGCRGEDPNRRQIWEWRFAICLEEAGVIAAPTERTGGGRECMWAFVDNGDAQLLTGLDACDLRKTPEALSRLRDRLFTLWGDLEELKVKQLKEGKGITGAPKTTEGPPPDSSDAKDSEPLPKERTLPDDGQGHPKPGTSASNRPFSCCLRQYGVRVSEPNPDKANAGGGKRWERAFGLFGTKVTYA